MSRAYVSCVATLALAAALSGAVPRPAPAFMGEGCAEKACVECHTMAPEEAAQLLGGLVDRVLDVRPGRVPGLYAVDVEKNGRKIPIYIDFSKKFLVTGDVVALETRESLTKQRFIDLNPVDPSRIALDDAVVIGDPAAPSRIVVFDDPECPYCRKLHPEMKQVAAERPDVAFFVKMLPLKIHPDARRKARAIICARSAQMLDDSLAGRPVPDPTCETDQVEKNEKLAAELGIRSTPTLVFPDGRVVPGYKSAAKILEYLDAPRAGTKAEAGKAGAKAQ
ncbi:MAG: hypothetical protein Kow0092_27900 [Deferrisomatales bacterium]